MGSWLFVRIVFGINLSYSNSLVYCILYLIACLLPYAQAPKAATGPPATDGDVLVLTDDNFEQAITEHAAVLVKVRALIPSYALCTA